jgi:hypothetical protein
MCMYAAAGVCVWGRALYFNDVALIRLSTPFNGMEVSLRRCFQGGGCRPGVVVATTCAASPHCRSPWPRQATKSLEPRSASLGSAPFARTWMSSPPPCKRQRCRCGKPAPPPSPPPPHPPHPFHPPPTSHAFILFKALDRPSPAGDVRAQAPLTFCHPPCTPSSDRPRQGVLRPVSVGRGPYRGHVRVPAGAGRLLRGFGVRPVSLAAQRGVRCGGRH